MQWLFHKPANKGNNNKKKKLWVWGLNGRFYQYLLNYENPHLSLKAAGHICVFHLQAPVSKVMHHYAKWSIVVTLIKSSLANTTLLQNNNTNLLLPLCKSNWSAKTSFFSSFSFHILKGIGCSSESWKWNITQVHILPPRGDILTEMRCDCDEHPNIRTANDENFNSFYQNVFKVTSSRKTNKLYESLCGCNPRGKIGKIIK